MSSQSFEDLLWWFREAAALEGCCYYVTRVEGESNGLAIVRLMQIGG